MFSVALATLDDVPILNGILSELIALGDNTAHARMDGVQFADWFLSGPVALFCLVARNDAGDITGFQTLSTYGDLPKGWADIGTFARPRLRQQGAGGALMAASAKRLRQLGFTTVNATVRADNVSGLGFYRKMGFVAYKTLPQLQLHDGRTIDRICHRLDL